jgi:hypothetical protein
MKRQLFVLLGIGLLLATASAYAQTIQLKADIPFSFVVGGTTLPGGEYTIRSLNTDQTLSISGAGQTQVMFLANRWRSPTPSAQSKLVFARYGDRYFLSEMWIEGHSTGRKLQKSRGEMRVAQNEAGEPVVVLAVLR